MFTGCTFVAVCVMLGSQQSAPTKFDGAKAVIEASRKGGFESLAKGGLFARFYSIVEGEKQREERIKLFSNTIMVIQTTMVKRAEFNKFDLSTIDPKFARFYAFGNETYKAPKEILEVIKGAADRIVVWQFEFPPDSDATLRPDAGKPPVIARKLVWYMLMEQTQEKWLLKDVIIHLPEHQSMPPPQGAAQFLNLY